MYRLDALQKSHVKEFLNRVSLNFSPPSTSRYFLFRQQQITRMKCVIS